MSSIARVEWFTIMVSTQTRFGSCVTFLSRVGDGMCTLGRPVPFDSM